MCGAGGGGMTGVGQSRAPNESAGGGMGGGVRLSRAAQYNRPRESWFQERASRKM